MDMPVSAESGNSVDGINGDDGSSDDGDHLEYGGKGDEDE
jgi:hypothetical protein